MDEVTVERIEADHYQLHYRQQVMILDTQALRDLFDILLRHMSLIEDEELARATHGMFIDFRFREDEEPK